MQPKPTALWRSGRGNWWTAYPLVNMQDGYHPWTIQLVLWGPTPPHREELWSSIERWIQSFPQKAIVGWLQHREWPRRFQLKWDHPTKSRLGSRTGCNEDLVRGFYAVCLTTRRANKHCEGYRVARGTTTWPEVSWPLSAAHWDVTEVWHHGKKDGYPAGETTHREKEAGPAASWNRRSSRSTSYVSGVILQPHEWYQVGWAEEQLSWAQSRLKGPMQTIGYWFQPLSFGLVCQMALDY